jgi:hypothetical protein
VDEVAVVVAKAGELVNVDHGGDLTGAATKGKGPPAEADGPFFSLALARAGERHRWLIRRPS